MLRYDSTYEPVRNPQPLTTHSSALSLGKSTAFILKAGIVGSLYPLRCAWGLADCHRAPLPFGIQVGSAHAEPRGDWREGAEKEWGGFVGPSLQGHLGQVCSLD